MLIELDEQSEVVIQCTNCDYRQTVYIIDSTELEHQEECPVCGEIFNFDNSGVCTEIE
jgi:ribosomal protein S27E